MVQRVAHGVEPAEERLNRLDLEPAVDAPVAQRRMPPRVQRRLELVDACHVEVGELGTQATAVDHAVAEVAILDQDVRDESASDELRVGIRPREAGKDAHVAALVEAEASGAAGDLRDLPRLEVTPLAAVELRGLGEEQRLARQVDPVAEYVGRGTHLGAAVDEAVGLLA